MSTKLTHELLSDLGFVGQGKSVTGKPLYRLEWEKNRYQLQVELNDYPEPNGNNGIVSIYYPELKDEHVLSWDDKKQKGIPWDRKVKSKRVDFIQSEDDDHIYGIKYITFPENSHPIAHNVTTLERLNAIYTALTEKEPLKVREKL